MQSISVKVIILIIVLILPLNTIAIIETNAATKAVTEQVRLMELNVAERYMADVTARMDNVKSMLYYLLSEDANCIRMRAQTGDYEYLSAKYKCYYNLQRLAGMVSGGEGYFFYMDRLDELLLYHPTMETGRQKEIRDFTEQKVRDGSDGGWTICECGGRQYLFLLVNIKDISYGGWIHLEQMKEQLYEGLQYQDCRIDFSEEALAAEPGYVGVSAGHNRIWLNISINRKELLKRMTGYHSAVRMTAFVYLLLIPVLYLWLHRLVIRPLKTVNGAHRRMQDGQWDYRITKEVSCAEYREVFASFNQMADNLKALKISVYEKEIERQKMELRNLQLQIRPHFLLNTFNLIFTLAQRRENKGVQDIVIYLSNYFRYIFRSDREVELFSKELQLLEGYADVVALRYPGQVEINFEFDPEIMLVRMPPLLILNFVENSVKYGVGKGKRLHICVWGNYEDCQVVFQIIDDGNGMDHGTLVYYRKILESGLEPEDMGGHIGLYNSLKRLKYFYGEEAAIEVHSEPGIETVFKIKFPYNLEVDDDAADGK